MITHDIPAPVAAYRCKFVCLSFQIWIMVYGLCSVCNKPNQTHSIWYQHDQGILTVKSIFWYIIWINLHNQLFSVCRESKIIYNRVMPKFSHKIPQIAFANRQSINILYLKLHGITLCLSKTQLCKLFFFSFFFFFQFYSCSWNSLIQSIKIN